MTRRLLKERQVINIACKEDAAQVVFSMEHSQFQESFLKCQLILIVNSAEASSLFVLYE